MARVLLLHGLGGTAATMQPLADILIAHGHQVHSPTLPGHGSEPAALLTVGWDDWLQAASAWPVDAPPDVVVGQSLGGSLALALASRRRCAAAVAINPPSPDPDAVEGIEWRLARGHLWADASPLADGEAGYTSLPLAALLAMAAGVLATDLAQVVVPVLLVTSTLDDVVDPLRANRVAAAISGKVQRLVLPDSGHVATLGPDQATLGQTIVDFIAELADANPAGRPGYW